MDQQGLQADVQENETADKNEKKLSKKELKALKEQDKADKKKQKVAKETEENKVTTDGRIVYKLISELTLLEANPRLIGKTEINQLCNSLETDKGFFEARPALVNKVQDKLIVYAGNMRVRAAIMLGWRLVPCIIDEIPNDAQEIRMFKDNMHYAEFDMQELLKTFDPAYLLHDIGMTISKKELSKAMKEMDKNKENVLAGEDLAGNFEGLGDETDENLYISEKFTNGTKPASFVFRQYEIPLSKETNQWLAGVLEDYKKTHKSTTNFMRDFRIMCQIGADILDK